MFLFCLALEMIDFVCRRQTAWWAQSRHKKVQNSSQVLIVALVGDDMANTTSAISPMLGIDSLSHLIWCCNSNFFDSWLVRDIDSLSLPLELSNSMSLDFLQVQDMSSWNLSSWWSSNVIRLREQKMCSAAIQTWVRISSWVLNWFSIQIFYFFCNQLV